MAYQPKSSGNIAVKVINNGEPMDATVSQQSRNGQLEITVELVRQIAQAGSRNNAAEEYAPWRIVILGVNMALKTLSWCPQPKYTVEEEPRRKVLNFGDGYQQRMADGINSLLRKYSVTYKLKHEEAEKFRNFMKEHGGVRAFILRMWHLVAN